MPDVPAGGPPERPPRAGVVGLGEMGGGMAGALASAGLLAAVHDVRPEAYDGRPALAEHRVDTSASLAATVDVAFLVVLDRPQLEAVLFGPEGLVAGARPGLVACVCSTVTTADVRALADRAAPSGVVVVDVGIAGGPDAAAAGTMVTTVGADDATFERLRPLLEALSARTWHAGPVGAGMGLKLVKNTMSYLTMCAVHESLLLGEELGFSSELVREVVSESNLVDHFFWFPMQRPSARPLDPEADAAAVVANRHYVVLAEKDLRAAAATADEAGVAHPVVDLATDLAPRYFLLPDD